MTCFMVIKGPSCIKNQADLHNLCAEAVMILSPQENLLVGLEGLTPTPPESWLKVISGKLTGMGVGPFIVSSVTLSP